VNQFKANAQFALVADRKQVTAVHHGFMGLAMVFVVDHFINSTFQHGLARQEDVRKLARLAVTARPLISRNSLRENRPEYFAARE
jgi:hypothetical protein